MPLADNNPIGACLVAGQATYYASRQQQTDRFPHVRTSSQIGQARAFLPLATRSQVYGVLVLLWDDVRDIPHDERVTIEALAAYTSQALQRALLFQDRMDALVTLQSALMPRLPRPENLTLAARYLPAATLDQIGGDWFDAVVMPNGRTALMIGDVIGHDISAAAKMGQVRSMLRAFALAVPESPSASVQRLDHALADLEMETMASLVYAQIVDDEPATARRLDGATPTHRAGRSRRRRRTAGAGGGPHAALDQRRPPAAAAGRRRRHADLARERLPRRPGRRRARARAVRPDGARSPAAARCCSTPTAWWSVATSPSRSASTVSVARPRPTTPSTSRTSSTPSWPTWSTVASTTTSPCSPSASPDPPPPPPPHPRESACRAVRVGVSCGRVGVSCRPSRRVAPAGFHHI